MTLQSASLACHLPAVVMKPKAFQRVSDCELLLSRRHPHLYHLYENWRVGKCVLC